MIRLSDDMLNWRLTYRIDQETAAQLANVSVRTWRNWETERFRPREDNYYAVRWVISQPPPWWGGRV
jgi:DNA-binding transcriptional regulator YiaG